jgi:predicted kinase
MKTLILTIGLPRSGKSTWAIDTGFPIVNRDSIRLALHGQAYIQEAEDMVTAIEMYMVKSLFLAGHNTIIIDATHLKREYRVKWENEDWEVKHQYFDTSKVVCIQRAKNDNKEYLVPIIERMAEESDVIFNTKRLYNTKS